MLKNYIKEFRDSYIYEDENVIDQESDLDKILSKPNRVRDTLIYLLSGNKKPIDDVKNIVTDIKCIQRKPTTFRVVTKNEAYFDLKYNPTPQQIKNPDDFKKYDGFTVNVSGKNYSVAIDSEYQQCLEYLGILLGTSPIMKQKTPDEQEPVVDNSVPSTPDKKDKGNAVEPTK